MTRSCALIPGFNVEKTIGEIIVEVKKYNIDVILIDDGSVDLSASIASSLNAHVITNNFNIGKGASLRKGFEYALSRNYDIIFTLDGDGQHLPCDVSNFLSALEANKGIDMILGNRMNQPDKMPLSRQITNKIMSKLISYICNQNIPDSQSGFRLIKSTCLKDLKLKSSKFEIESEMLLEAAKHNKNIISVPISSIYKDSLSRINPLVDAMRFIKFVLPYALWRLTKRREDATYLHR